MEKRQENAPFDMHGHLSHIHFLQSSSNFLDHHDEAEIQFQFSESSKTTGRNFISKKSTHLLYQHICSGRQHSQSMRA